MELNKQVCLQDQGKKLRELGVLQKSHFWHYYNRRVVDGYLIWPYSSPGHSISGCEAHEFNYSAFTGAELGVAIGVNSSGVLPAIYNNKDFCTWFEELDFEMPEAHLRAMVLIYALEEKLVTVEEVNLRLAA